MLKETMTPMERITAAVQFKEVDRTPIILGLSSPFLGRYKGMTPAEAYKHLDVILNAEEEIWSELGGWELRYGPVGLHDINTTYPFGPTSWSIPRAMPGAELPDYADVQNREEELMHEDEYERLFELGWMKFWVALANRTYGGDYSRMISTDDSHLQRKMAKIAYWKEKHPQTETLYSPTVFDPVTMLATWRSAPRFMLDICNQYDNVRKAIQDVIMPEFFQLYKKEAEMCNCKFVMVTGGVYQMPFVTEQVFEDLQGDWITDCTNLLLDMGKIPVFHLDGNWTDTLPWFKKFPKGTCVLHLDGGTDIKKAKELFAGHMCIMGDLSPVQLQTYTKDETKDYCEWLIREIGKDNGFIMSEGCFLSAHSQVENVRTMVEVAKNYKPR